MARKGEASALTRLGERVDPTPPMAAKAAETEGNGVLQGFARHADRGFGSTRLVRLAPSAHNGLACRPPYAGYITMKWLWIGFVAVWAFAVWRDALRRRREVPSDSMAALDVPAPVRDSA